MSAAIALTGPAKVRFENVEGSFADGARVRVTEEDLEHTLPRLPVLPLDGELNCLVVGVHWLTLNDGLVILPTEVTPADDATDLLDHDYDRVVYIDRAIETLQRARAILTIGPGRPEQVRA